MLDLSQSEENPGNTPNPCPPPPVTHTVVCVCFSLRICVYVLFISRNIHLSETPSTIWRRGVLNGLM